MDRPSRYDGLAEWYDEQVAATHGTTVVAETAVRLLGQPRGRLLDIGCGTGLLFSALVEAGWSVTGIDSSEDQLRVARRRARELGVTVESGDAGKLPFSDRSFDAACLVRVLTDVDEPTAVLAEAARVVTAVGPVVIVTVHPCFVGPNVRAEPDSSRVVLPGYRETGWHSTGPGFGEGIRSRVGARHVTLSELLEALAAARLHVEAAEEPGDEPIPVLFAMRARALPAGGRNLV